MRSVTTDIFTYEELTPKAQEKARDWYIASGDYWPWGDEWNESLSAFERIAPISVRNHDIDRAIVTVEWRDCDGTESLTGLRAWKWLTNNGWFTWAAKERDGACGMTGFCGDCPFGDALKEYERSPLHVPDLEQVFYEMVQSWVQAARADLEYSTSEECVGETLIANEYEFDIHGNFWR